MLAINEYENSSLKSLAKWFLSSMKPTYSEPLFDKYQALVVAERAEKCGTLCGLVNTLQSLENAEKSIALGRLREAVQEEVDARILKYLMEHLYCKEIWQLIFCMCLENHYVALLQCVPQTVFRNRTERALDAARWECSRLIDASAAQFDRLSFTQLYAEITGRTLPNWRESPSPYSEQLSVISKIQEKHDDDLDLSAGHIEWLWSNSAKSLRASNDEERDIACSIWACNLLRAHRPETFAWYRESDARTPLICAEELVTLVRSVTLEQDVMDKLLQEVAAELNTDGVRLAVSAHKLLADQKNSPSKAEEQLDALELLQALKSTVASTWKDRQSLRLQDRLECLRHTLRKQAGETAALEDLAQLAYQAESDWALAKKFDKVVMLESDLKALRTANLKELHHDFMEAIRTFLGRRPS